MSAKGGTGHGGVKGTQRTACSSQHSSEGKDLKRPDVGSLKCGSIESNVPHDKPKTREELIEGQVTKADVYNFVYRLH